MYPRLLFASVLTLASPALFAQTEPAKKELTEKTSEGLGKLRPLTEAKDYAGALALVDSLLPLSPPRSFDLYVLSQIKAQILLTQGKLSEAIAPMETALALGEANSVFSDPAAILDQLNLLAQLHYQRAAELKGDAQKSGYATSLDYARRLLQLNPKPTAEQRLFAASLLYQSATTGAKPDATLLREAITQAREGLLLEVNPPTQIYLILVACHLQLGENAAAGELLETLAMRDPKSANTWSQLQSIYLSAAADTKDSEEVRRQNLRALHVLDRAQAAGHLNTPKDNYTRVAILFNIQQYSRAAALLETGITSGSLEGSKRNWELLASAYQQTSQDGKALDALTRAVSQFPEDAALEFSLAQFLYNTGKVTEAYGRGQAAVAKGTLEKPGQAKVYLAYLAYELQRYDEALKWVADARAAGDVPASTLDPLNTAITEAIRSREAATRT